VICPPQGLSMLAGGLQEKLWDHGIPFRLRLAMADIVDECGEPSSVTEICFLSGPHVRGRGH